jgi:DNA-binding FadR family transcriptional regulator
VRRIAEEIRDNALRLGDGQFLGAQETLMRRYGVSRPTLLQAIGLLTQENLIWSKSGPYGGYYIRQPASAAVGRAAAVYLRSCGADIVNIVRAMTPVRIELAKLAAQSGDAALRTELALFLRQEEATASQTGPEFMRAERQFVELISTLSDNSVFSLFYSILLDCLNMSTPRADVFTAHPDRVSDYRSKRNILAQTILMQDAALAALAAERCAASAVQWMLDDLEPQASAADGGRPSDRLEIGFELAEAGQGWLSSLGA